MFLKSCARAGTAVPTSVQAKAVADAFGIPATDTLTGTVTVHNANWKAGYLANHVVITDATLHVGLVGGLGDSVWDAVDFTYGPLKGTASFTVPGSCDTPEPCPTQFQAQFGDLDAATVQTAILGAREKGTLLTDLINRLRPSSPPVWPRLQGTVKADSLVLGPVTLTDANVDLDFKPTGIEITSLNGNLLGGNAHGAGKLATGDKPDYTLTADFEKLNPVAVGQLLGENWRGGSIDANGKIELVGYTGADLAGSAKGTLHFEWRHGAILGSIAGRAPQQLTRPPIPSQFDSWTSDAVIADGKIVLGQNEIAVGSRKHSVEASVTLAESPKLSFPAPKLAQAKKH